jgi:hypothetical protein
MKNRTSTSYVSNLHLLIFAMVLPLAACKPMNKPVGTDSEVSTVDNFAAGKRAKEQVCGPTKPSNIAELSAFVSGPNEQLRFAAVQSLAAVPSRLRGAVFGERLKGRIKIVSAAEISRQCGSNPSQFEFENEAEQSMDFCWKKPQGSNLEMWVRADEKIVRHGILRLVTYVYLQLIEDNLSLPNSPNDAGAEIVKAMNSARSKLALNFIADATRNPKFASRAPVLRQTRNGNALNFDRKLFVEMIDSVYCNAESLNDFRSGFPTSFNEFVGKNAPGAINFTSLFGLPWHAR